MPIIKPSDFDGPETGIANNDTLPVQESIQWLINEYEPKLLKDLLGETLYSEFSAGYDIEPLNPIWTDLEIKVKPAIVKYVWYYWTNSQIVFGTGTGTKKAESDNSSNASAWGPMVTQWNKMVEDNRAIYDWLKGNVSYPDFELKKYNCFPEIFHFKNRMF